MVFGKCERCGKITDTNYDRIFEMKVCVNCFYKNRMD